MLLEILNGALDRIRVSPHRHVSRRKTVGSSEPQVSQYIESRRHRKARVHIDRRRRQWLIACGSGLGEPPIADHLAPSPARKGRKPTAFLR